MSMRLVEMQAAKAWGKTPTEFWALERTDQVYMIALELAESRMKGCEMQVAEEAMEKAAK